MKKTGAGACWECHDDFLKEAKFKHQPVEDGDCGACHNPHASAVKGLLSKPDPQICAECHEEKDMAKVKAHQGMGTSACSKCHNPHAGADKYFLTPDGLKAAAPATKSP